MSQEICYEAMRINPASFFIVPVHFKTKGWSIKAIEVDPWQLESVSDHFKTLEMCDKAVREDSFSLQYVPDWFVTQEQVKSWHDDDGNCNDVELVATMQCAWNHTPWNMSLTILKQKKCMTRH